MAVSVVGVVVVVVVVGGVVVVRPVSMTLSCWLLVNSKSLLQATAAVSATDKLELQTVLF